MDLTLIVIVVVVTALAFDFTNGFHDTANAMATSIATGALKPRTAVIIAGALNFVGAFLSVTVATTISKDLFDQNQIIASGIGPQVIFAGLCGAILWNLLTWLLGLPSSSSHALFGGLIGAMLVALGTGAIKFGGIITAVLLPAVLSPIIAGIVSLIATYIGYRIAERGAENTVRSGFKAGQIVSASMVALAHGTNDAQKTMGVITLTLIAAQMLTPADGVPFWVKFVCAAAIALGTYLGGWRIIRTLGKRVGEIETPQGFAAETTSGVLILASSSLGFALSTTQVASGSIFGAAAGKRLATVQWSVAGQMAVAWLLTLPAAAAVGAIASAATNTGVIGTVLVIVVVIALSAGIFLASRRKPVTADNVNDVPAGKQPVPVAA